ncbi:MAG: hypothetical protein ACYC2T_12760 [Bacillota bacterium]
MAKLEKLDLAPLSPDQLTRLKDAESSMNQGVNKKIFLMALVEE